MSRSVGHLDDGRRAIPVRKTDTEDKVRAVFDAYDDGLTFTGDQVLVDWCPHTELYRYEHGCDDWCERPVPKWVWVASWAQS